MKDLFLFDALTRIGPRQSKHPNHPWKLEELVEELDHCSISGALVRSSLSLNYDPHYSNLKLSRELEPYDHLFAVWNVMPHQTGEFPEPKELERHMQEHNVRAVSIAPASNAWDWRADHSQVLLEWLQEKQILTYIDQGDLRELGSFSDCDEFLGRYPRLPVLATGFCWPDQRYLIPLMQKHKNLHITFERYQVNRSHEYFVENGCEDQIIFGSNAPIMSAGAHRLFVDYARMSDAAQEKMASGNLVRLLKGQKPPCLRTNENEDEIMAEARQGKPLSVPILDLHMHTLFEGLQGSGEIFRMQDGGPKGIFEDAAHLGYNGGGFMSWAGVGSCDVELGHQETTANLDVAPSGYWGLATLDPSHYTQTEMEQMMHRFYQDKRFIGMKPYPRYGVQYHESVYDLWWEYGNENNFYAILHLTSYTDFVEVKTLAEKYPKVRWLIAHAAGDYFRADLAIEAMQAYPNIYAEITYTPVPLGIMEYYYEHIGADRLLYGTDLPMRDPRQQLGWVVYSRLSVENKKKILAGNAMDMLRPCWDRLPEHNRPRV